MSSSWNVACKIQARDDNGSMGHGSPILDGSHGPQVLTHDPSIFMTAGAVM